MLRIFLFIALSIFLLNLLQPSNQVYSILAQQCDVEICGEPTVRDPNLQVKLVSNGLHSPTSMAFLGANDILVLERYNGKVQRIINNTIQSEPILDVNVAAGAGERGMLGIAVSKVDENTFVYLYFTESKSDGGTPIGNRLYKYEFVNDHLLNPKLLLDLPYLPGPYHNGGAITIGPDKNIYLTIGDLDNVDDKQRPNSTIQNVEGGNDPNGSGGILRITQEGQPVGEGILGNKYPLNLYYAYGVRNSFGIDFDPVTHNLWDTENGPNYGDEINLVKPGFNSGWKKIQGFWELKGSRMGVEINDEPEGLFDFNGKGRYSVPEFTWKDRYGPTAIKFLTSSKLGDQYENDPFIGDVHHGYLYHYNLSQARTELSLPGLLNDRVANTTAELQPVIFGEGFGGITDLEIGDDGYLYVVSYINGSIYRIMSDKR